MSTSVLYHPLPFGEVVAYTEPVGAVLSMLTETEVTVKLFPALSVMVPVTNRPVPSALIVWSVGTRSTPDKPSSPSKWKVTSVLYHPLPFGEVVADTEPVGAVLSMLTETEVTVKLFPALSVMVPVTNR